jgi:glycosyltransferase involved in cell wall biosynthesis
MADVSVIIPTRNRAAMLKQAIDSILAQSEPVREIIVIDDGSTDNTLDVLRSYDSKIRLFSQCQGGPSAARNRGFREAVGEWIAFLDDDDVWLETKIEKQMAIAAKHPEAGLIYCGDLLMDGPLQKVLRNRTALAENRGDVFEHLLLGNFIYTSCVIVRREAIRRAGDMDLKLRFAEDWDLWLRIAAFNTVEVVSEPLVLYRWADQGLTVEVPAAERCSHMEAVLRHARSLRPFPSRVWRQARFELTRQLAWALLEQGKGFHALRYTFRMFVLNPASLDAYRFMRNAVIPKRARLLAKRLLAN